MILINTWLYNLWTSKDIKKTKSNDRFLLENVRVRPLITYQIEDVKVGLHGPLDIRDTVSDYYWPWRKALKEVGGIISIMFLPMP
jgi:hypothetical protein